MGANIADVELGEAEALDRYVSGLLAGKHTVLPADVDAGELRAYLMATVLFVERCHAGAASQATATEDCVLRGMPRQ
jgi:hypothetical protein